MALPFKKAGGGFLNNVTGVIIGLAFDLKLNGGEGDKAWRKLNGTLTVKTEGADEPVETFIDGGFIYDSGITVKGAVIGGTDECPVRENTELAGLVGSMVESGLDEAEIGAGLDYTFLTGLRVNFIKVKDEERTKRTGGRKDKKTGKVYPHELVRVNKVFGREAVKATAGKSGTKATGTAAPSVPAASTANVDDVATAALLAFITKAKDNKVKVSSLGGAFVKYCLENNIGGDDREPIRNRLVDTAFLQSLADGDVITFDGKVIGATE